MEFIDQDRLQSWYCHHSFGDHGGIIGKIPQAFMKKANETNLEFVELTKIYPRMILFIDNLRLYKRKVEHSDWEKKKPLSLPDRLWLKQFEDEDLLKLCAQFPENRFIIFTGLEDIPLDETIRIPANVDAIHACNAVYLNEKIHPWPHGLTRINSSGYNLAAKLMYQISKRTDPQKLLYINHREDTGTRKGLRGLFADKPWATIAGKRPHSVYLDELDQHKFVLCPSGNGIDSCRNWETLYLGRVPVLKDHPYLRALFKGFPAIFVNEWEEVTEDLLMDNIYLLEEAQGNFGKLDLAKMHAERTGMQVAELV